jgi:hypothetical protein
MVAGSLVSFVTVVVVSSIWQRILYTVHPREAFDIQLGALGFGGVFGWATGLAFGALSIMGTRPNRNVT